MMQNPAQNQSCNICTIMYALCCGVFVSDLPYLSPVLEIESGIILCVMRLEYLAS